MVKTMDKTQRKEAENAETFNAIKEKFELFFSWVGKEIPPIINEIPPLKDINEIKTFLEDMSNSQIEFIRADIEADFGYSKIIIISNLARKLKAEGKSREETLVEIERFRKEKKW